MKIWERLQFEVAIRYSLFPADISWREWLFSPVFGMTYPGQKLTSMAQLPEGVKPTFADDGMHSRVFWLHGAIRVLGLDLGMEFSYLLPEEVKHYIVEFKIGFENAAGVSSTPAGQVNAINEWTYLYMGWTTLEKAQTIAEYHNAFDPALDKLNWVTVNPDKHGRVMMATAEVGMYKIRQ